MKLYNSIGPNPKVVRMFMKEKGIEIPLVKVDLMGGENRREPYLSRNPSGQLPCLELDDGTVLAEVTAICEYLDDTHKTGPSLIGSTAKERAETHMWTRRIDLNIVEPMANGFRFAEGAKLFQNRIRIIPEAAEGLKATAKDKLVWLDKLMEGKEFVVGSRLTLADILLFAFIEFGHTVKQPLDPALKNLNAWYGRMKARPSAAA
ncbi:MAG TPA: glutathione S-transferase family protein [Candidatus Cybelea sp.]|nr:glutathione S-transferase family protein [Candidatus Cybelea sp.]